MGRIVKKERVRKVILPTDEELANLKAADDDDEVFFPVEPAGGKCRGKSLELALERLSAKSRKIRKGSGGGKGRCRKTDKISGVLKSALSLVPGMKSMITDHLPQALERIHDHIPIAMNVLLPMALKTALPGNMNQVAGQAVANKVTPFIQDQVYPAVVDRLVPEDVRYEIARKKSLQECSDARKTSRRKHESSED
eukprot:TRINITY_DN6627_c0_g1_i1.p1 TRINITY_DN6627_c0_g1~~TRINITY_DN6627_c0_g1_i1.p1  ORF type:complete len:210 (-),score=45.79 TRINITY_DN6627_c0_g1_i1:67-654(-)